MFSVPQQTFINDLSFEVFEVLRFLVSGLKFYSGVYFVNVSYYSSADVIEDLSLIITKIVGVPTNS